VLSLARQFRVHLPWPFHRSRFHVDQVRAYLHGEREQPGTQEIGDMVARLPALLRETSVLRRYSGFPRYVDVLPRIIFLYTRGVPVSAISEDLNFLATDVGVETVVEITARLVTDRLNRA